MSSVDAAAPVPPPDRGRPATATGPAVVVTVGRTWWALGRALPELVAAFVLVWLLLEITLVVAWNTIVSDLFPFGWSDLLDADDYYRAGVGGAWDLVWERVTSHGPRFVRRLRLVVLGLGALWLVVSALVQSYAVVVIGGRVTERRWSIGQRVTRTLVRTPSVLASWMVTSGALGAIGWLARRGSDGWPWSIRLLALAALVVGAALVTVRLAFVPAIVVLGDDPAPVGRRWAQGLSTSWATIHGRTARVGLVLVVVSLPPVLSAAVVGFLALQGALVTLQPDVIIAFTLLTTSMTIAIGAGTAAAVWSTAGTLPPRRATATGR